MSFEDDLKISKGDDFSETADDIVLYVPRGGTQKRQDHHKLFLWDSVNREYLFVNFVKESENAFVNEFGGVTILTKNPFQVLNFSVNRFE